MVVGGGLEVLRILDFAGQLGRGMDEGGEALRANIDLVSLVLQDDQGDFIFGSVAVQACLHLGSSIGYKFIW